MNGVPQAQPIPTPPKPPSRRWLVIAVIALAVILIVVVVLVFVLRRPAPAPATRPVTTPVSTPTTPEPTPEPEIVLGKISTIVAGGDLSQCASLSEEDRVLCLIAIEAEPDQATCLSFNYPAEYCSAVAEREQVSSIEQCEQISDDSLAAECYERYASADDDGDGLSYTDERDFGTDPNNPDTDGDGFSDGEEIENGFNPLGEGRL